MPAWINKSTIKFKLQDKKCTNRVEIDGGDLDDAEAEGKAVSDLARVDGGGEDGRIDVTIDLHKDVCAGYQAGIGVVVGRHCQLKAKKHKN